MKWSKKICIEYLTSMRDPLEEQQKTSAPALPDMMAQVKTMQVSTEKV